LEVYSEEIVIPWVRHATWTREKKDKKPKSIIYMSEE
jgi:hypothetical protein